MRQPLDQSNLCTSALRMLAMSRADSTVFALLVLSVTLFGVCQAGNCSTITTPVQLTPSTKGSILYLYGGRAELYSAVDGVNVTDSLMLAMESVGIAERTKIVPQNTAQHCITPDDPLANKTLGGRPVSPIRSYYSIENMDCYVWTEEKIIEGVKVRGAYVNLSSPLAGDFRMTQAYEFADSEIEIFPNNETTHTAGKVISYHYLYGQDLVLHVSAPSSSVNRISDPPSL